MLVQQFKHISECVVNVHNMRILWQDECMIIGLLLKNPLGMVEADLNADRNTLVLKDIPS